jgi:ribonuclease T2
VDHPRSLVNSSPAHTLNACPKPFHSHRPDNCDGSFQENCDSSRAYGDITTLLQNAGKSDLLNYMNNYWQSNNESPEKFWEHEWATHGTCVNTIDPSCYFNYQTGDEAVDFFQQVVTLFKTLDTYQVIAFLDFFFFSFLFCLFSQK